MYFYIIKSNECRRVTNISDDVPDQFYSYLNDAHRVIDFYIHDEILHDVFTQVENWCSQNPIIGGNRKLKLSHEAERLCRGFLYEFRTCHDHIETEIKRTYGKESELWKLYERLTHDAYDNHAEYGFTCHLRNCAQHCLSIVHGYNGTQGVGLSASSQVLQSGYDKWKDYDLEYMAATGENIDLLLLFRRALEAYDAILSATIQYLLNENNTSAKLIYIKEWGDTLRQTLDCDVNDLYVVGLRHADGSLAAAEELESHKPGILIDAHLIDWDTIYSIVGKRTPIDQKK